jgi:serine/threonine protein kinase
MWSLGVVLYTMLGGENPFRAEYLQDLIAQIKEGRYSFPEQSWGGISASAKELISLLLRIDPKKRLTSEEALLHPWVCQKQDASPFTRLTMKKFRRNTRRLLTKFAIF